MRSNWLPEIIKRAQSGPYMKESEFDLKVTRRIKELVRENGIVRCEQPVPGGRRHG